MKTLLKIFLWTIMALLLLLAGSFICVVKMLEPRHLTPIATHIAGKYILGDVKMASLRLSFEPSFPTLRVSVDSATVISHAFRELPAAERGNLPAYADTLLRFNHFSGAISLDKLLAKGEIALRDVRLNGAAVNIVIARDSLYNFDIIPPSDEPETEDAARKIPAFSIDHFRLEEPRAIRYFNAVDSTAATIVLEGNTGLDGTEAPTYSVTVFGDVDSPQMRALSGFEKINFGADGKLRWDPARPELIAVEHMSLSGAFLRARVDAAVAFTSRMMVESAGVELDPVRLDSLLRFVPEDIRRKHRLRAPWLRTDATIGATIRLTAPMDLTNDTIPHAVLRLSVVPATVDYGKFKIRNLSLDLEATMRGNDPDSITVNLGHFTLEGPATSIALSGEAASLVSDPAFEGCLKAHTDISRLPAVVANAAGGYLSGLLDADIDFKGRMSMFDQAQLHRLDVSGHVEADNFFYLRNDTGMMAQVNKAMFKFGTDRMIASRRSDSIRGKQQRTLVASVSLDTANLLVNGVGLAFKDFSLGVGVENSGFVREDTTEVLPMGGRLRLGRFSVTNVTDTAGMRLRDLAGHVSVRRFRGRKRTPEFVLNLTSQRMALGAPVARVMLSEPLIKVRAHRLPGNSTNKRVRHMADSIARVHPDLSPDSVYRLALAKRQHRPGEKRHHRVHTERTDADTEIIEWGTSTGLRRLFLDWDIRGTIRTTRGRLYTPAFPLRNRLSNVDIRFNTDSILIRDLRYRAGRSDLAINGVVSNLQRAFTSKRPDRNHLKINFDISSAAVDVNQIAAATFAGASWAERRRQGLAKGNSMGMGDDSEDALDRDFEALVSEQPSEAGPLLLPTNIDAQIHIKADSIFYSDLSMSEFAGDILLYDGGLNLHNLRCTSPMGSLGLDALYAGRSPQDLDFGFGLDVRDFDIRRFLSLMPAIDSIMPLMRDFGGYIDANVAATVRIDSAMNLMLPTLHAAVRLEGDSLQFIDPKTYRTIGKWLGFKDKTSNVVKHLNVELTVQDNVMRLYPFIIDIDRYRLGVEGYNTLDMQFNYHVAVLKSPIPFKFGVTFKGTPEDFKVRLGGAKFKADAPATSVSLVDTARVNLLEQIQQVFRRGVRGSRFASLNMPTVRGPLPDNPADTVVLNHADSLMLIREGIISAPSFPQTPDANSEKKKRRK